MARCGPPRNPLRSWLCSLQTHNHDGLAAHFARINHLKRVWQIFKREFLHQARSHRALLPQAEDVGLDLVDALRSPVAIVTPLQAAHANVLHEKVVDLDARYLTGSKADNDQSTAPSHRTQRRAKEFTSERVDHNIRTDATG